MNGADPTTIAIVAAVTNGVVLTPIVWLLLRQVQSSLAKLHAEVGALVVAIALDVSTRPYAPERSKAMADQLIRDRVPETSPIVVGPTAPAHP